MKPGLAVKPGLMIAILALSSFALAQHGRGGGASMGGGGGMGASGERGAGVGASASGGMDAGTGRAGSANAGRTEMGRTPSEILSNNTKLSSNLDKLLPQGTTAQQACSGFKNVGQCAAAIHVSHNLDIPFADLKSKVTGSNSVSLGSAIKDLKPNVDVKPELKKAKHQAEQDVNSNS
ncbi:MAG TPA: hypothetical protein VM554_14480 [Acidisarcina sp.]|nr:hypothetical protein [Acidisarcina sp.]